jgi:hypothetical protein
MFRTVFFKATCGHKRTVLCTVFLKALLAVQSKKRPGTARWGSESPCQRLQGQPRRCSGSLCSESPCQRLQGMSRLQPARCHRAKVYKDSDLHPKGYLVSKDFPFSTQSPVERPRASTSLAPQGFGKHSSGALFCEAVGGGRPVLGPCASVLCVLLLCRGPWPQNKQTLVLNPGARNHTADV